MLTKILKDWWLPLLLGALIIIVVLDEVGDSVPSVPQQTDLSDSVSQSWHPPLTDTLPDNEYGNMIRYGRDLIANTSKYFGPRGSVVRMSNGMNCQNCHLDAGTKIWGNNYSAVNSTYPRFRERSGSVEDIFKRINDCIERSLNGRALDTTSKEIQAMAGYINWVGQHVPKGKRPDGAGITDLPFLNRPADPSRGRMVYQSKCSSCHGVDGKGLLNADSISFLYPPLWGNNSYNTGAGLYRISRFAGYVRDNMPFGASHNNTVLSVEDAWDVAAFVNSQPRPTKKFAQDWPNIAGKPIDHPFGPFADKFSEAQHKFGPFGPIKKAKEETAKK